MDHGPMMMRDDGNNTMTTSLGFHSFDDTLLDNFSQDVLRHTAWK